MTDVFFPMHLGIARASFRYLDSTAVSTGTYTGAIRTAARGGDKLAASVDFTPVKDADRAAMIAFLARLRGRQNRVYLYDPGYTRRGSFPATEVFTNNTFANGTTGWSAQNSTLSVQGRVMRLAISKASTADPSMYQSPTVVQYAPYVLRGFLGQRSRAGATLGTFANSTENYAADAQGMISQVFVPNSTSAGATYPAVYDSAGTVTVTGDFLMVPFTSLSRCGLADSGPNLLLQSQDFTTTWANTRSSDAANSTTAPDGTTTADSIIEDATASNTHEIQQGATVSTAAASYAFSVSLKAGTRTFARIQMVESTSNHICRLDVNLSTGAIDTPAVTGANWTNPRAFVVAQADGWYRFTIIGRKVSAGTTVTPQILLATALGTTSYNGDGASLIYAWGASLAQSSVPVRYTATTTTASTGSNQTGSGLHVKGLPASTAGLLLEGDLFEVITSRGSELKIMTAPLDSNAAGEGYAQFEPPLRGVPADNAPFIVTSPMGRFVFTGEAPEWMTEPGVISRSSLAFEEAGQ